MSWSNLLEVVRIQFLCWMPPQVNVLSWHLTVSSVGTLVVGLTFWRICLGWVSFYPCCGYIFSTSSNVLSYRRRITPPFRCIPLLELKAHPDLWVASGKGSPGSRSLILTKMAAYLSLKDHNDSSFSWRRLTRSTDVMWWGQLVTYCTLKRWAKEKIESMDRRGKHLYHVSANPLWEVGKTLHITALSLKCKLNFVMNASKYSLGSEVPSYLSIFRGF